MRLIDSTIRRCAPGLGVGRRWLRESLAERHIRTYLSEGCLQELVRDADASTWRRLSASGTGRYLDCLREEIAARTAFIQRWTASDEPIDGGDEELAALVRIARKYALPRPWKLSEPVASQSKQRAPSYWRWASGAEAGSARAG